MATPDLPNSFAHILNSVNCIVCFTIGVPLNILLVWLTLKKMPDELRVNAKILLPNCVFGIILLAIALLLQPIPFMHQSGVLMVLGNGFSTQFPRTFGIVLIDFLLYFIVFTAIYGPCAQFVCRFLILYRKFEFGTIGYFAFLAAVMLFNALLFGYSFWIGFPNIDPYFHTEEIMIVPPSIVFSVDKDDSRWSIWCIVAGIISLILCLITIFCALKLPMLLRKNLHLKPTVVRLNQQMNRSMCIRLFLTLFAHCAVFILIGWTILAPQKQWLGVATTNAVVPILLWANVANPLVTIATIAPLRLAIRACFVVNRLTLVSSPPQSTTAAYSFAVRNPQLVHHASPNIPNTTNNNLTTYPFPHFVLPSIDADCRRQSLLSSTVYTIESSCGGPIELLEEPIIKPDNRRASLELPPVVDRRMSRIGPVKSRSLSSTWSQNMPLGVIRRF